MNKLKPSEPRKELCRFDKTSFFIVHEWLGCTRRSWSVKWQHLNIRNHGKNRPNWHLNSLGFGFKSWICTSFNCDSRLAQLCSARSADTESQPVWKLIRGSERHKSSPIFAREESSSMSGFRSLSLRMGPIYCFVAKGRILVPCSTFSNLMLHRYIFKSRMPFSSDSLMDNYLLRRNLWAVFPDILNYADLALYISSSRRVAPLRLMPFSACLSRPYLVLYGKHGFQHVSKLEPCAVSRFERRD